MSGLGKIDECITPMALGIVIERIGGGGEISAPPPDACLPGEPISGRQAISTLRFRVQITCQMMDKSPQEGPVPGFDPH